MSRVLNKYLYASFLLISSIIVQAQMSFYQDNFLGGVTGAGYSPDYFQTAPVTGVITVNIQAGSTIRRAYLMCGRLGPAPNTVVTLNGTPLTFDATNQVTPTFNTIYGGNSAVHAINVTGIVSAAVNVYNLGIPAQSSTSNRYQDYYLYIAYDNGGLPSVATAIFLNTLSAAATMNWGTLTLTNPFNLPGGDAAYSFFGGYECSSADGENLILNGTNLGNVWGQDINSGQCGGPVGSFYYRNNVVTALSDDNISQSTTAQDALSKFNAIAVNGATTVSLNHTHAGGGGDNHPWGGIFAYKSGAVLPIELSSFTADCLKDKAILNWTTSTEINNEYFTVERSNNAVDFIDVARINGSGNSTSKKYYSFTDAHPESTLMYYRLKQTNKDGTSSTSQMVMLEPCQNSANFAPDIFPNPASENLNINFKFIPVNTKYAIINNRGEEIYSNALENKTNSINVSGLNAGIYLIRISDGENTFTIKFVKK